MKTSGKFKENLWEFPLPRKWEFEVGKKPPSIRGAFSHSMPSAGNSGEGSLADRAADTIKLLEEGVTAAPNAQPLPPGGHA